jgi:hypothetical protein
MFRIGQPFAYSPLIEITHFDGFILTLLGLLRQTVCATPLKLQ